MPEYVLNRDWPLQGFGHSINFKKGEPTWVPPLLVPGAVAIGAQPVDGEHVDVLPPEETPSAELTPQERETLMFAAFEELEGRNGKSPDYRDDFNAQGLPNVKALSAITGFTPSAKERNEVWQKYREARKA